LSFQIGSGFFVTEMSMESLCQALLTSPHTQTRDFILIALVFLSFFGCLVFVD
jgi:hypothetical protein